MMTRDEAIEHIKGVRERWKMYAMTKEAFIAIVSTYIYVFIPGVRPYEILLKGLWKGASLVFWRIWTKNSLT